MSSQPKMDVSQTPGFTVIRTGLPSQGVSSEKADSARAQFEAYRALVARAVDVFGDEIKAARWLSTPSVDFAGHTPIQAAEDVEYSRVELERLFEPVFVHIEEGIYS